MTTRNLTQKANVLWLPETLLNSFQQRLDLLESSIIRPEDQECIDAAKKLLNSNSKSHMDALKKVSECIKKPSAKSHSLQVLVLQILANGLYFDDGTSLKSVILGVINRLPPEHLPTLSEVTRDLILSRAENSTNSFKPAEFMLALLQTKFGQKIIHDCFDSAIHYFRSLLCLICEEAKHRKLVTETARFHADIHLTTRTILSVLNMERLLDSSIVDQLLEAIVTILNMKGIPLEVQANCSKILVLLVSEHHEDGPLEIVEKVTRNAPKNRPATTGALASLRDTTATRVNLCLALLTSLKCDDLCQVHSPHGTLLGGIILSVLLESCEGLNDASFAVMTARLLDQWLAKCLDCVGVNHAANQDLLQEWNAAKGKLLEVSLNGMEHQIDSVRHTAKGAFLLYLKIQLTVTGDADHVVGAVLSMPRLRKSKYMALAGLARTPELVPVLLRMSHNLAQELLQVAGEVTLSHQAREVFNLLMSEEMRRKDSTWVEFWLHPLLNAMENSGDAQNLEHSLIELLKKHPEMISWVQDWFLQERRTRLSVYMTALLSCKRLGLPLPNSQSEVHMASIIQEALQHGDDKVRLNAFGVIVDGPKSTQLFSKLEMKWIQMFIHENMASTSPAFRQQLCAYMKKLLRRLLNGGVPLIGKADGTETLIEFRDFLAWLTHKCFSELGPGSNFARRFVSLQFLKLVHETVGLESANPGDLASSIHLSRPAVFSLVDCFFDSYDVIKDLALSLLQTPSLLTVMNEDPELPGLVELYRTCALALSRSLRSADTVAATYFFRWLVHLEGFQLPPPINRADSLDGLNSFTAIETLAGRLKWQLDAGNLLRLAIDAPIYGSLSSIRFLLADQIARLSGAGKRYEPWSSLISDVIDMAFKASRIASPVVTSDSPEGFLPDGPARVNAQSLLVSAWRTVKEVALLFGGISSWALDAGSGQLLESRIVVKMGWHLRNLLLETKHRGAFEHVYNGFYQLCGALLRSSEEEFHQLPATWLRDLIRDLEDSHSASKLCATRRSAGLPFVFQAILSLEVELGQTELFASSVESLLSVASSESVESRIHALNILRALYRESRLNQVIGPYVAQGLMLAIAGFEAQHWPERNSSTLLFSALMTRIFGVPRSKVDCQKRNSLTGRVFFQLYPQLYPFLLDRFELAVQDIVRHEIHLHPSLFPLLVLMGRLTPSASENPDDLFQLQRFVPLVERCGSSPVLKTRQLAAQALSSLVSPANLAVLLPTLLASVSANDSHNELHGKLLQVRQLVKDLPHCQETRDAAFRALRKDVPRLTFLLWNASYLIRNEYILLVRQCYEQLEPAFLEDIKQNCLTELRCVIVSSAEPFYPLYCRTLTKFVVRSAHPTTVMELLNHPLAEVRLKALKQLNQPGLTTQVHPVLRPTLEAIVAAKDEPTEARSLALSLLTQEDNQPAEVLLEAALTHYQNSTGDSVRCVALRIAGRAIRGDNTQLLLSWSECLLDAVESDLEFRMAVVSSLSENVTLLKDPSGRGDLIANLWTCLFSCLTDDDESVRMEASTVVANVISTPDKSIQPVVAMEAALSYFTDVIGPLHPVQVVMALTGLVLNSEELPDQDEESQSFTKDDNDSFYEPLHHSSLYCRFIQRSVSQNSFQDADVQPLVTSLQNFWKGLGTFDISDVDSLTNQRRSIRVYGIDLFRLLSVAGALKSVHPDIAELFRDVQHRLQQLPRFCVTQSLRNLLLSNQ